MGASIFVEWPGSSQDQQAGQPGFWNDCKLWADFLVNALGSEVCLATIQALGVQALLCHNTDGLPTHDIGWATPEEFIAAADTLRQLVERGEAAASDLVSIYADEWDRHFGPEDGTPAAFLAQDLKDVAAIARYAQRNGAGRITLAYHW